MTDLDLSLLSGRNRRIPEILLQRTRELRLRQTTAECILWECLRSRRLHGFKFRRQHNIGRFIADFYCHEAKLVIELDGLVHKRQPEKDAERDAWMQACGLKVLRFENRRVFDDIEGVLEEIGRCLPG
ncbi:endonuclease domain-containing protein [Leptolyngbyaceae cyanobacterium CCMR0082]|uniref:Endonuclease domain-containing protein n=1 Tax=Adonisia turfae CCMR0082 TaxID=2304604 RepID=A0A6M0SHP1_9CYAN|nr:DUF559 domain-containing protein [Adonisia turfae]NEZ67874.1 endonuclease domain-containing protein [Adonisia turfae CCMR0082]